MKILLIDFSGSTEIEKLIKKNNEVIVERNDGGKAYTIAGNEMPDLILINYAAKPTHGRQTAIAIKGRKKTASIPVLFIGGSNTENEKVLPIGQCIAFNEIMEKI